MFCILIIIMLYYCIQCSSIHLSSDLGLYLTCTKLKFLELNYICHFAADELNYLMCTILAGIIIINTQEQA